MLGEYWQGFWDCGDCCCVLVIVMGVGDDYCVNVDNFIVGKWQFNQWIVQFVVCGVWKIWSGVFVCQYWIDEKFFFGVVNNLGCIMDVGDVYVGVFLRLFDEYCIEFLSGLIGVFG